MWLFAESMLLMGILGMPHSHAIPCAEGVDARVVSTTADASNFAEALLCSGAAQFEVDWSGEVVLEQTIIIMNGSSVTVTGIGPAEAVIDGGGNDNIFTVLEGSTLALHSLSLVGGWQVAPANESYDIVGGAIYIGDDLPEEGQRVCQLTASNCSFIGNTADQGGAIYSRRANVFLNGITTFANNTSNSAGGAFESFGGNLFIDGDTTFANNTSAESGGGAIYATQGNLTIDGVTTFLNNKANTTGGALEFDTGGILIVRGTTVWKNNAAGEGGALALTYAPAALFDGDVLFANNFAAGSGGDGIEGAIVDVNLAPIARWRVQYC